jgi:hypothetical protein
VLLLGSETYVVNALRYHNPIWPVRVDAGPLHFPGPHTMSQLFSSGANGPRTQGNLARRVFDSWTTVFPPQPVFDMRVGGLGMLFLIALPFAIVSAVRSRSLAVALVVAASLAVPDPSVARFAVGFAGLVIALAVSYVEHLRKLPRYAVFSVVTLAAAQSIVVAYPGLHGEGPPLTAYPSMNLAERQRGVGPDGPPAPFLDAIAHLRPGDITVFDSSAELPYYSWPFDLSHDAHRIGDDVTVADAQRIIADPKVGMLIVGDQTAAGAAAREDQRFVYQFHCHTGTCAVYLRR